MICNEIITISVFFYKIHSNSFNKILLKNSKLNPEILFDFAIKILNFKTILLSKRRQFSTSDISTCKTPK